MSAVPLSVFNLAIARALVFVIALLSLALGLGIGRSLLIGIMCVTVQLMLIGVVLKVVFEQSNPLTLSTIVLVMVVVGSCEVGVRQQRC